MLCFSLHDYNRACLPVSGGISDMVTFDPEDINFTQPAPILGKAQKYSAISIRPGAVGTGATSATATVTVTAVGADGDIIAVYYGSTFLGSFTKTATETTPTLLAQALKTAINNLTSVHGFTVTGAAAVLTVIAPASYGASPNTKHLIVDDGGTITATETAFTGGVTGTGGKLYNIKFQRDEAQWTWTHSVKGCSVKYEHKFAFQLPELSHAQTVLLQAFDAASCCCGLGIVMRMNTGAIFIAGEKYVNSNAIPRFTIGQNGSTGDSGKLYDDANAGNIVLLGNYTRMLYEFSGTWADIESLL